MYLEKSPPWCVSLKQGREQTKGLAQVFQNYFLTSLLGGGEQKLYVKICDRQILGSYR